jgi:hypothetical protein
MSDVTNPWASESLDFTLHDLINSPCRAEYELIEKVKQFVQLLVDRIGPCLPYNQLRVAESSVGPCGGSPSCTLTHAVELLPHKSDSFGTALYLDRDGTFFKADKCPANPYHVHKQLGSNGKAWEHYTLHDLTAAFERLKEENKEWYEAAQAKRRARLDAMETTTARLKRY